MLSVADFVEQSLELHLFFDRIMKEHSFFLETSFTGRDASFTSQADMFRQEFDRILAEAVPLSNGVVSPDVIQSGEVISQYTLNAEALSAFYTGVQIQTGITQAEAGIAGSTQTMVSPLLEQRVVMLNQRAIAAVTSLIQFKTIILTNVLSCKMFTTNYPLLLDHILREAKLFLKMLQTLQRREDIDLRKEAYEQELFWNRIMAEHSKFIRGLLDPTENDLIVKANDFGNEFDKLTAEAQNAMDKSMGLTKLTNDSLEAVSEIREFKAQGTQGLVTCKIKSIIIPLLGDHTLREANHFFRLLNMFKAAKV